MDIEEVLSGVGSDQLHVMVGIPQGCPLSMVFSVALYVPWCRRLEAMPDVKPQLYADNLECTAELPSLMPPCLLLNTRGFARV